MILVNLCWIPSHISIPVDQQAKTSLTFKVSKPSINKFILNIARPSSSVYVYIYLFVNTFDSRKSDLDILKKKIVSVDSSVGRDTISRKSTLFPLCVGFESHQYIDFFFKIVIVS